MPGVPQSDPRQFVQGSAVLHVPDVLAAAEYYRDNLGFSWDFGDDQYAVVWRDNAAVHFARGLAVPNGVHLFVWVRDVDAYHKEIVQRGVKAEMEPTTQPYGIREFMIKDVNGVAIVFGQDDELL